MSGHHKGGTARLPVNEPGVYDIDIDDYHSQRCCPGPSVSSSGLRVILRDCPALFYAFSDLNPARFEKKVSTAFAFGKAAHALVLGEPEFNSKFILSPFDNFMTKEARAWRDDQKREIVRKEDMEIILQMVAAQRRSAECMRAFTEGVAEKSILWQDRVTGIWLKSRPDWLPIKPEKRFTTEYKTADSIKPRKLNSAVFDYGYEMQAALTRDAIATVIGANPLGIAHVVQEKSAPFLVDCRLFTPEQIDFGRMEYRKALRIFAKCLETDVWPGYTSEASYFETPFWVSKAMENFDDGIETSTSPDQYSAADYLGAG